MQSAKTIGVADLDPSEAIARGFGLLVGAQAGVPVPLVPKWETNALDATPGKHGKSAEVDEKKGDDVFIFAEERAERAKDRDLRRVWRRWKMVDTTHANMVYDYCQVYMTDL